MNIAQKQIHKLIAKQMTPSLIFVAQQRGRIICEEILGKATYQETNTCPINRDTIYDIASVTKIIVATGFLMLVDQGLLSLDDKRSHFLPACSYGERVTIRHLLTHTSGISIRMSGLADLTSREQMVAQIMNATLVASPGQTVFYTNANTFLLGKIIEVITGKSLDAYLKQALLVPLKMQNTCFNPPERLRPFIPPTEITTQRGLIQGKVHDESAYALGGVVGHAGLFSTVTDLSHFCQFWLREGAVNGRQLLSPSLIQQAIQNQAPPTEREVGLGWEINSDWMGKFGPSSIGHTGFTGPSIMISPKHAFFAILLMNRTYPQRTIRKRHTYQAPIMNALFETLT